MRIEDDDVQVQHEEHQESPGEQVMPHVYAEGAAHQRDSPAHHVIPETSGVRLRVERETRNDLGPAKPDHENRVGHAGKRVMPQVDMAALEFEVRHRLAPEIAPPRGTPHERESGTGVVASYVEPVH